MESKILQKYITQITSTGQDIPDNVLSLIRNEKKLFYWMEGNMCYQGKECENNEYIIYEVKEHPEYILVCKFQGEGNDLEASSVSYVLENEYDGDFDAFFRTIFGVYKKDDFMSERPELAFLDNIKEVEGLIRYFNALYANRGGLISFLYYMEKSYNGCIKSIRHSKKFE